MPEAVANEVVNDAAEIAATDLDALLERMPPEATVPAEAGKELSYRVRKALRLKAMGWANKDAAAEAGLSDQWLAEVSGKEAAQNYLRVVEEECVRYAAEQAEQRRLTYRDIRRMALGELL